MWLVAFFAHGFVDPPAPSHDVVRLALQRTAEKLQNRRVKYVRIILVDETEKEFPPIDHPDRVEVDFTMFKQAISNHSSQKTHRKLYRSGALWDELITADDHGKMTHLRRQAGAKNGPETQVEVGLYSRSPGVENIELRIHSLAESISIRSSLKPSKMDPSLFELLPLVDDRAVTRARYVLDSKREFWPTAYHAESKGPDGAMTPYSSWRVHEFQQTPFGWYPRNVVNTTLRNGTELYTVTSIELLDAYNEADFRVPIPKGLRVRDHLRRLDYIEGGEEIPWGRTTPPTELEQLRAIPLDDWLVYGGFVIAVSTAVVGAIVFFAKAGRAKANKGNSKVDPKK